jgi:superfamily II DNA or RNA helicase
MSASTFANPVMLRPYQVETIEAVLSKWREYDRLLVIKPTGGGKR